MKVLLQREGITPANFTALLAREIRAGQHKAWEVTRARPLTLRHKGRFRSLVTFRLPPRRQPSGRPSHDLVASITGKDAGLVLRYFVGLVTMKLAGRVKGLYVPLD